MLASKYHWGYEEILRMPYQAIDWHFNRLMRDLDAEKRAVDEIKSKNR